MEAELAKVALCTTWWLNDELKVVTGQQGVWLIWGLSACTRKIWCWAVKLCTGSVPDMAGWHVTFIWILTMLRAAPAGCRPHLQIHVDASCGLSVRSPCIDGGQSAQALRTGRGNLPGVAVPKL